jgi:hypothetical protein
MRPVRKERDVGSRGVDDALARPDSARKRRRNSPSTHLSSSGRTHVPTARREPHRLSTSPRLHKTRDGAKPHGAARSGDRGPAAEPASKLEAAARESLRAPSGQQNWRQKRGQSQTCQPQKATRPREENAAAPARKISAQKKAGKSPPKKRLRRTPGKKCETKTASHQTDWASVGEMFGTPENGAQIMSGEIAKTCESVIARQWPRAILDS